jgi:hypothetical protein
MLQIRSLGGQVCKLIPDSKLENTQHVQIGVEVAVEMLRNASTISFMRLEQRDLDLLDLIRKLTPLRVYYPSHLTSMQSEQWDPILSSVSQDSRFSPLVDAIIEYARTLSMFDQQLTPSLPSPTTTEYEALRRRAEVRSRCYRLRDSSDDNRSDDVFASLRGCLPSNTLDREALAFEISSLVMQWSERLQICRDLWDVHLQWNTLRNTTLNPMVLTSFTRWLNSESSFGDFWLPTLYCCRESGRSRQIALMYALGSIAFRHGEKGLELARTLLACAIHRLPTSSCIIPKADCAEHSGTQFNLSRGLEIRRSEITEIVSECVTDFSGKSYWSSSELSRKASEYRTDRHQQIEHISGVVFSRWPDRQIDLQRETLRVNVHLVDIKNLSSRITQELFAPRYPNHLFRQFVKRLQEDLDSFHCRDGFQCSARDAMSSSIDGLEASTRYLRPTFENLVFERPLHNYRSSCNPHHRVLEQLLEEVSEHNSGELSRDYAVDLHGSITALEKASTSVEYFRNLTRPRTYSETILQAAGLWPRAHCYGVLSLLRLNNRERFNSSSEQLRNALVAFAKDISAQQKARRLDVLYRLGLPSELIKESGNRGEDGWKGSQFPDWLLIQVFTLRHVISPFNHNPSD